MSVIQTMHVSGNVYTNGTSYTGRWDANEEIWVFIFQLSTTAGSGFNTASSAHAWIPPYTGPIDSTYSVVLHVWIMVDTIEVDATIPFGASIVFDVPGGGATIPYTDMRFRDAAVPNNGEFNLVEVTMTQDDLDVFGFTTEDVLGRLAGGDSGVGTGPGARAIRITTIPSHLTFPASTTRDFYIDEAWLTVEGVDQPPVEVTQQTRQRFARSRRS